MCYNRTNFVSHLNIPNQIEQFGDLRFYWEGSNDIFIYFIKPFIKNVRKKSSFLSLQFNTLNSTTMLKNLIESENGKEPAKDYEQSKSIITYSSINDKRIIISNGDPPLICTS